MTNPICARCLEPLDAHDTVEEGQPPRCQAGPNLTFVEQDDEAVEFSITVRRDAEAGVWWVSACNVPGMHLESDEPWKLIKRCVNAAPELIELNGQPIAAMASDNGLREAAQFALDELKYMPAALSQWAGGMGAKITTVRKRLRAALSHTNGDTK